MLLKKLQISNFRCFEKLNISFNKLTTIVGENGTGKTAILEAINFAFSPSFLSGRIDEQDFNNADAGDIKIKLTFEAPFKVGLNDGYATQEVSCQSIVLEIHRREKASPGKALSDGFVVARWFEPASTVTQTSEGWELKRKNGTVFTFSKRALEQAREIDGLPRCFYFNKERENQAKIGFNSTLQKVADEFDWRLRKGLEGRKDDYLTKWNDLYDHVLGSVDAKKIKETVEPVRKKLKELLGDGYEKLELSILNLEQPFSKSFFALRDGINQVDLSGFGSGVSMILAYLLLETISELSKESLLILIDEPELHLHHQLRKKFRDRLNNSESQVILSTHADDMVDIGAWRSVKRMNHEKQCLPLVDTLKREIASKSIGKHLDEIGKFYQDKLVFTKENNILLFSKKCVLVEGPTDKYAIEVLGAREGSEFNDLTIISCNGKEKVKFYQLLCTAFEIPFFTLFDLDGKSETDTSNAEIIASAYGKYYYGFKDDLSTTLGVAQSARKSATMLTIDNCTTLNEELVSAFKKIQAFIKKE